MAKKKFITMRVDQEVHDYLSQMAERETRTITNLLTLILIQAIELDREEHRFENV